MGLLEIARNQKRDFGVIHFSGDHQPERLRVDYFLKDEPYNIERLIEMAEYFESGKVTAVLNSNIKENHRANSKELLRNKDNIEITSNSN